MSNNQYGLDNDYFERKIAILHRDGLNNWTPDELARELARMSRTADKSVMQEPEFAAPVVERQEPVDSEQWWADTPDGDSALVTRVTAQSDSLALERTRSEIKALCKHPSMSFHQVALLEGILSISSQDTSPPAPVSVVLNKLEMAHVVEAHMEIAGCPILTSNQCHALAVKLNAYINKELNQ